MRGRGRSSHRCRRRGDREFRPMSIDKRKPRDAPEAEPRAEPVDEIGEIVVRGREPVRLFLVLAFDRKRRETQNVEAETGIERVVFVCICAKGLDLLAEEPGDRGRIAQRPARAGDEMFHPPVDAEQTHVETPRTLAVPYQELREFPGKREDRRLDGFAPADRLEEAPLGEIGGSLEPRRDRRLGAPEHGVELFEERDTEPRRQRSAWAQQNVVDSPEPRLGESGERFLLKPQSGERQRTEAARDVGAIRRHKTLFAEPCQSPRRFRCRADATQGGKAQRSKPRLGFAEKLCFAAEEMRRAGDVEHHAVRRIERGKRRKAPAPIGDRSKRRGFGNRIGRKATQAGEDSARIGNRHAGPHTAPRGGGIDGGENLRVLDLKDRRDAARCRTKTVRCRTLDALLLANDPIRRQRRQRQGEITRHEN